MRDASKFRLVIELTFYQEVLETDAVKAFVDSKILDNLPGTMAIGSSTTIY